MRIYENGLYRDLTPAELAAMEAQAAETERRHWLNTSYDDAVDAEIRKRYSVSQEFAILRQRDEKPDEYAEYYSYCEECKAFVKQKMEANQRVKFTIVQRMVPINRPPHERWHYYR